eukprot:4560333-Lingulodinium_polyedra.AAC.1
MEGLQDTSRMLALLMKPIYDRHSEAAAGMKSQSGTRAWYLAAAKGRWVEDLWAVAKTLMDVDSALPQLGL